MNILVTGVSGTLGRELASQLLVAGHHVTGVSRTEEKQSKIPSHKNLKLRIGDIQDREAMVMLARGKDIIFHLAAMKFVDICEENPLFCFRVNVEGTANLLYAAEMWNVPRLIFTSTDKACEPQLAYGFSKAAAERLVLQYPRHVVCRYGNVLCSDGSVIPTIIRRLKDNDKIYLTNEYMTRFWITPEKAAEFVRSQIFGTPGLKVPEMKAASMKQLVLTLAEMIGKPDYKLEICGLRTTEKIHEQLLADYECSDSNVASVCSNTADSFSDEELKEMLLPFVKMWRF